MMEEVFKCEFCANRFDESFLQEHLLNCEVKPVDCENNCGVKVYQRDLNNHRTNDCIKRNIICKHCDVNFIRNSIDDHYEICPKMKINCPHSCDTYFILREDLNTHFDNVCTVLTKPCSFEYAKCTFRGTEHAMDKHLEESYSHHFELFEALVVEQKQQLEQTVEKLTLSEHKLSEMETNFELLTRSIGGFVWKINNWAFLKKTNIYESSPEFYTNPHGYKIKVVLYPNGYFTEGKSYLSMFIQLVPGIYDDQLNWPFTYEIKITLLNQIGEADHTKTVDPNEPNSEIEIQSSELCFTRPELSRNNGFSYNKFISHKELSDGQFIKDDSIYLKFHIKDKLNDIN